MDGFVRLDNREYEPLDLFHQLDTTFPNLQSLETTDRGVGLGDLKLPSSLVDLRIINYFAFVENKTRPTSLTSCETSLHWNTCR